MRGSLVQTNYRLFFLTGQANASFSVLVVLFWRCVFNSCLQQQQEAVYGIFPLPLAVVSSLELKKDTRLLQLLCKDYRFHHITINPNEADNPEDILRLLKKGIFPKKLTGTLNDTNIYILTRLNQLASPSRTRSAVNLLPKTMDGGYINRPRNSNALNYQPSTGENLRSTKNTNFVHPILLPSTCRSMWATNNSFRSRNSGIYIFL